jgi:hypothetical protein
MSDDLPPELSALASPHRRPLCRTTPARAAQPGRAGAGNPRAGLPLGREPEGAARPFATAWPWRWSRSANLPCRRQGARLIGQIDALVYELYGLTDEEIRLVEGRPAGGMNH